VRTAARGLVARTEGRWVLARDAGSIRRCGPVHEFVFDSRSWASPTRSRVIVAETQPGKGMTGIARESG